MTNIGQSNLYPQGFERGMIVLTVMLVAVLEILDMTIVNVALSPMMGALGANSDQITWVLTSYIVSAAIFMVLTGFLVEHLGRKRLLIMNIAGFTIASMLCGMSHSLSQVVFFRTLQGIFGASLVPLSQIIVRSVYPREEHGKAMAFWGLGVMVAPVIGPTLGGYIIDYLSWRWIFFVNLPVGLIGLTLAWRYITESQRQKLPIDYVGMLLLAVGVGALQLFLDRGNNLDWFSSQQIWFTFLLCFLCLGLLVEHVLRHKRPIVEFSLYKNRNFVLGSFILLNFSVGVLGVISLEPLLLEELFGYPAQTAGLVMLPIGVSSAIAMVISGWLTRFVDMRFMMFIGLCSCVGASFHLSQLTMQTDFSHWIWIGVLQGFGMGLVFVPLSVIAMSTLSAEEIPMASGLYSFARNLGSSIGISMLSTIISRSTQTQWNRFSGHLYAGSPQLNLWLQHQHWKISDPIAIETLKQTLYNHSTMIAFTHAFQVVMIWFILLLPFVWGLKVVKGNQIILAQH